MKYKHKRPLSEKIKDKFKGISKYDNELGLNY